MEDIENKLVRKILSVFSIELFLSFDFDNVNDYLESKRIFGLIGPIRRDNPNYTADIQINFYFSMPFESEDKISEAFDKHNIRAELQAFDEEVEKKLSVEKIFETPYRYEGHPWQKVRLHRTYCISEDSI